VSFDEPYYPNIDIHTKSITWRFWRADGEPWMLAGLWSEWTDKNTGEIVPNYTMITQNCDGHPLLSLMHKPERDQEGAILPAVQQDKRSVVPLEKDSWDEWLHGSIAQADALINIPTLEIFSHSSADMVKNIPLPGSAYRYQILDGLRAPF
jgi:putative SOS response-associated peptidase YedK